MTSFLLLAAMTVATWQARITGYTRDCEGCTGFYHYGGERADWKHRSIAVSDSAAAGRDRLLPRMTPGSRWVLTFPEGDRITYTVRDRCPACRPGTIDLLVRSTKRARDIGGMRVKLEKAR